GDLPLGPAAVCDVTINVQRLSVEAAVRGDDALLRQAMMLDPLVGAVCSPPEIWRLVDEMLVAQKQWLPQYGDAIAAAEKRIAAEGTQRGTSRATEGAYRLPVRTPEQMAAERVKRNRPGEG
ncbi:MAG: alpha-glucosidase/alpha-galactosidase, partial [Spirochaetota bacterium]